MHAALLAILLAATASPTDEPRGSPMAVVRVRVEGMAVPLGIDDPRPRISWNLKSRERGAHPLAFQVLATDGAGLTAWDSGRVDRPDALDVVWAGRPLRSRDRIAIRVRAWDGNERPTRWSDPVTFEMGLLEAADWTGRWIAASATQPDPITPLPSPHLRRAFTLARPVVRARAYIAGLGFHEAYVNGRRVGTRVLDPAFTRFDRRVPYVVHDVTDLLTSGANTVGVILGNGFYNPSWTDVWGFQEAPWRATPRLLFQLEIEHDDGTRTVVASDASWRTSAGPILRDAIRNGERYDARREMPGWSSPGFADGEWAPVALVPAPAGALSAQQAPPVRVTGTLPAKSVSRPLPGVSVFDFGQNLAGWVRLNVSAPAGTAVTIRYGERLSPGGTVDQTLLSRGVLAGGFQTDQYTTKGSGTEVWEPRFVYHGFRYAEVTGLSEPALDSVAARVVHSDFPRIGSFSCSDDLLNRIYEAAVRSYLSNFVGIPTDCPQREKNGWMADAHLAAEFGLLTFDGVGGYTKWARDIRDEQRPNGALPGIVPTPGWGYAWGNGPAWDSALFLVPWYAYLYTGDPRPLVESADAMRRYLDYLASVPYADENPSGWLGDWVHLDQVTPPAITHAGFHVQDAEIAATTARLLGDAAEAARYDAVAAGVRRRFQERYLDPATGRIGEGTQTAQAVALFDRLVTDDRRASVLASLLANLARTGGGVNAGVLGAKWLPRVLTSEGRADVAYRMVSRTEYPGWGNGIARGATTLWEDFDGGQSLDHAFFADVAAWFTLSLAGIAPDPAEPGWKRVLLRPQPVEGLAWAQAEILTARGTVSSRWSRERGAFTWRVTIPVGSRATLVVPFREPAQVVAPGCVPAGSENGFPVLTAGSGDYEIRVTPATSTP